MIRVLCESYRNPCSLRRAVEGESKAVRAVEAGAGFDTTRHKTASHSTAAPRLNLSLASLTPLYSRFRLTTAVGACIGWIADKDVPTSQHGGDVYSMGLFQRQCVNAGWFGDCPLLYRRVVDAQLLQIGFVARRVVTQSFKLGPKTLHLFAV